VVAHLDADLGRVTSEDQASHGRVVVDLRGHAVAERADVGIGPDLHRVGRGVAFVALHVDRGEIRARGGGGVAAGGGQQHGKGENSIHGVLTFNS